MGALRIMASKGKKGGKKKGQTLNLTEFLGGDGGGSYRPPGSGATTTVSMGSTWAEEMDEEMMERPKQQIVLPTAPRAALGPAIDDDRIPRYPPFTAYIANLPYDVDEEAVKDVFLGCKLKILTVRLMKEEGGRLKGYGYADFEDRDSLCDALSLTDLTVNNRKMRIDIASGGGKEGDRRGGGGFDRMDPRGGRGRDDDPDAGRSDNSSDWRSGPPPSRDSDRDRDRGRSGGGFDRYEPPRDRDRGFGGGGGFRDRYDRDDRGGGRSYGFSRDDRDRRSPDVPKERPRLNLAPRTKPKEEEESNPGSGSREIKSGPAPKKSANIFGNARPVDTTQREREIEQKLGKMEMKDEKEPERQSYRPPGARDRDERRGDDRSGDRYDREIAYKILLWDGPILLTYDSDKGKRVVSGRVSGRFGAGRGSPVVPVG